MSDLETINRRLAGIERAEHCTPLTRANADTRSEWHSHTLHNADGTPVRYRRNGMTKTWKRRPERFAIPAKFGLYRHLTIDEYDTLYLGYGSPDCPRD
jgi:hypothetical protein